MPAHPLTRRVVVACGAVLLVGTGVGFGWTMVRYPRFRDSPPAPGWLPWLTAVLCLGALAVGTATIVIARALDDDSGSDDPAGGSAGAGPAGSSWSGTLSEATVLAAVAGLFVAGLSIPALAAVDSEARWDPLRLAVLLPVAALVVRWWWARQARRR